ncbi:MAG: cytochrome c3 family protein [Desulfatirhabdiaceae bacterium]
MTSKKHLQIAYSMTAILLVIGLFSYAAFSAKKPDQPIRIMYKGVAGSVLFDHKAHAADRGYGLSCNDCHHHPPGQDSDFLACSACHKAEGDTAKPESCKDCHDPSEYEDYEMVTKTNAFHAQCIECHQQIGAGPVECAACHATN